MYRVTRDFSKGLSPKESFILRSAALVFNNLGFVRYMETNFGYTPEEVAAVMRTVDAGMYPQFPGDGPQKLFCDAVASELATREFVDCEACKRSVLESNGTQFSSDKEWFGFLRILFETHSYQTNLGESLFAEEKDKNLARIIARLS